MHPAPPGARPRDCPPGETRACTGAPCGRDLQFVHDGGTRPGSPTGVMTRFTITTPAAEQGTTAEKPAPPARRGPDTTNCRGRCPHDGWAWARQAQSIAISGSSSRHGPVPHRCERLSISASTACTATESRGSSRPRVPHTGSFRTGRTRTTPTPPPTDSPRRVHDRHHPPDQTAGNTTMMSTAGVTWAEQRELCVAAPVVTNDYRGLPPCGTEQTGAEARCRKGGLATHHAGERPTTMTRIL